MRFIISLIVLICNNVYGQERLISIDGFAIDTTRGKTAGEDYDFK